MDFERPPTAQIRATGLDLSPCVNCCSRTRKFGSCIDTGWADAPMPVCFHSLRVRMSSNNSSPRAAAAWAWRAVILRGAAETDPAIKKHAAETTKPRRAIIVTTLPKQSRSRLYPIARAGRMPINNTRWQQAQMLIRRNLKAFVMTETDDRLMAADAIIGDSSRPNTGYSTPAATGTPTVL